MTTLSAAATAGLLVGLMAIAATKPGTAAQPDQATGETDHRRLFQPRRTMPITPPNAIGPLPPTAPACCPAASASVRI